MSSPSLFEGLIRRFCERIDRSAPTPTAQTRETARDEFMLPQIVAETSTSKIRTRKNPIHSFEGHSR